MCWTSCNGFAGAFFVQLLLYCHFNSEGNTKQNASGGRKKKITIHIGTAGSLVIYFCNPMQNTGLAQQGVDSTVFQYVNSAQGLQEICYSFKYGLSTRKQNSI